MKKIWLNYWIKDWYFLYKIGYALGITGSRSYFKNFKYEGKSKIPKNAGIVYAVNHQNAFLDPIVLAGQTNAPLYYLTRADIFKKKLANKLLRQLYMLPIFRQRDGVDTITKNEMTFIECYDILKNQKNLVIFPEGNHNYKKLIRPLKKGLARIALGTQNKFGKETPVYIIPLGIDYENHFNMNSDILLNAGNPIDVSEYYDQFQENNVDTINKLTFKVYDEIKSLIINIEDQENYEEIYYLLHRFPLGEKVNSVIEKFNLRQEKLRKTEQIKIQDSSVYIKLLSDIKSVQSFTKKNSIRPYLLEIPEDSFIKLFGISIIMLVLLPVHLMGLITNYIPYKIPVWIVENKIKDKHFHSSLKQVIGVVLFILYWLIITIFIFGYLNWKIGVGCVFSLPLISLLNFRYWIFLIKIKGRWNYRKAIKKEDFLITKKAFDSVQSLVG